MWPHEWLPPEVHLRDTPHFLRGAEPVRTRLAGYVMGEALGREPRFWGFGGLKPFSPGPRLAVGVRGSSDLHEYVSSPLPSPTGYSVPI